MTTPLTPGVYVREAPGGARAIGAAPTAVTIFVGETERGPVGPIPISSPIQYGRLFGGYFRADGTNVKRRLFMPDAIGGFFENGGPRAYVLRLVSGAAATMPIWETPFAGASLTGAVTAVIRARAAGAAGDLIQVRISDATSGGAQQFNLEIGVSTDGGATFPPRATDALYENLNATEGDPDNVLTRLAGDPDVEWLGPAGRPTNRNITLSGGEDAEASAADLSGSTSARVQARILGPGGGNLIQVRISDATSGDAQQFNLEIGISTDNGATFPPRATTPLYENLSVTESDLNNALTRLVNDPDIEWVGPAIRPVNGNVTLVWTVPTVTAGLRALGAGVWGNEIRIVVADSADGDLERFNLIVFYRPPGEVSHSEVERFEGLSPATDDEKYVVDQLVRSNFVEWDPEGDVLRPGNFGDAEANPPGFPLAGGTGGNAAFPQASYPGALALLDGIEDAALIVCAADDLLNPATTADNHNALVNQVLAYVERRPQRDLFLVADAPRSNTADPVGSAVSAARTGINASNHLGLYWPRIVIADPAGVGRNPTLAIPAAGHVAGIYGRIDGRRGVWKVAAGLEAVIGGAVALDFHVLDKDQERMNPHGLNALRTIPGAGRVIWGGRTRQPTTEWRYINVRRTAMFLRKSIYNGIQWAVFEGNDERLWAALRESIGAFMEAQFRNGAFAGATSREAYFVKCDADTTTPDDQAAGIVNVQVGFAPLRPAEFVIVTLSQMTRR